MLLPRSSIDRKSRSVGSFDPLRFLTVAIIDITMHLLAMSEDLLKLVLIIIQCELIFITMFLIRCVLVNRALRAVSNCPSLKKSKVDLLQLLELIVESFPRADLLELCTRFDWLYFHFTLVTAQVGRLHHT